MKKLIWAVLFVLLTGLLFGSQAEENGQDAVIWEKQDDEENTPFNIMTNDEKVYMMISDTLYRYDENQLTACLKNIPVGEAVWGMEEAKKIMNSGLCVDYLFFMDGQLYGINLRNGQLFPIDNDNGNALLREEGKVQLSWEGMTEECEHLWQVRPFTALRIITAGHKMYAFTYNDEIYEFDLFSGERQKMPWEDVVGLGRAGDHQILLLKKTPSFDNDFAGVDIFCFDTGTGQSQMLDHSEFFDYQLEEITYCPQNQYIYFISENEIYQMKNGKAEVCAYLPSPCKTFSRFGENMSVFLENTAYVITELGVYSRRSAPEQLPKEQVFIAGMTENDVLRRAAKEMAGIPVICNSDKVYADARSLAYQFINEDARFDIYAHTIGGYQVFDFDKMMEKGYVCPLENMESVAKSLDQTYPYIQKAISQNGQYYAYPVQLYLNGIGYYPHHFKMLEEEGISLTVPKTLTELCEFVTVWNDEYADTYADYILFNSFEYSPKETMYHFAMTMYGNYLSFTGQEMKLDTEEFRQIMTVLDSMHTENLGRDTWSDSDILAQMGGAGIKKPLFELNYSPKPQDGMWKNQEDYIAPLEMTLLEDTPFCMGGQIVILFINAHSPNQEAARTFIQLYDKYAALDKKEKENFVSMRPSVNDPIENEDSGDMIEAHKKNMENIRKELENCDPVNRDDLKNKLQLAENLLADYEKNSQYRVTAEDMEAFHTLAQSVTLQGGDIFSVNFDDGGSMTKLFKRYIRGQIKLEQFIREGENKLNLIRLENQ